MIAKMYTCPTNAHIVLDVDQARFEALIASALAAG
jgi:hypothetical protein